MTPEDCAAAEPTGPPLGPRRPGPAQPETPQATSPAADHIEFLVSNSIDRYSLSQRDTFVTNADGSVDLYLQAESPSPDGEAKQRGTGHCPASMSPTRSPCGARLPAPHGIPAPGASRVLVEQGPAVLRHGVIAIELDFVVGLVGKQLAASQHSGGTWR